MAKTLFRAYFTDTAGSVFGSDHPEFHQDTERFNSAAAGHAAYVEQERAALAKLLKPRLSAKRTVYTILRHVSASGMSRRISLIVIEDGKPRDITFSAALIMGDTVSDKGGIVVPGCGMDMGFHLVYALGSRLWPKGTGKPHGSRNGEPDTSGGYALNHAWL